MGVEWLSQADNWKLLTTSQKERLIGTGTELIAQQKLSKAKIDFHLGIADKSSPFWNKNIPGIYQSKFPSDIADSVEKFRGIEIDDGSLLTDTVKFRLTDDESTTFLRKLTIADEVNKRKVALKIEADAGVKSDLIKPSIAGCAVGSAGCDLSAAQPAIIKKGDILEIENKQYYLSKDGKPKQKGEWWRLWIDRTLNKNNPDDAQIIARINTEFDILPDLKVWDSLDEKQNLA